MKATNWRTTAIGLVAAIGILCNILVSLHAGHPFDANTIAQLIAALGVGAGGVAAGDAKNSN